MADARSPTVRRRELGALLRKMRQDAGLTVQQAAERLLVAPSSISRLETGQRGASPRDIRDLCGLYGVADPAVREHLDELAREGRKQAWWQGLDLPYATYVGLEAEAVAISDFEPGVVPGLLQVPGYSRALHENVIPRLSQAGIAQRVEERRHRQAILTRSEPPPPRLHAILDESVLHRVVGSPGVMAAQLDQLVAACELPNVTVQVLGYGAGAHPALDSTFILLRFAPPVPAVVYVEGLLGQKYLDQPSDVERYERVFDRLRELALDQQASIALMASVRSAYEANGDAPQRP